MDTIQILQKSIEMVQHDLRDMKRQVEANCKQAIVKYEKIQSELVELKGMFLDQGYQDKKYFNEHYVRKSDFENYFHDELEKYNEAKNSKLYKNTELTRNMLQIISFSIPLLMMVIGYFAFWK
jgi:hypothetical protein